MKGSIFMVVMAVTFGFAALAGSTAGADIYSWTDENGVKYFTNYAPPKQATLFMKTPEIPYDEEADNERSEMDRMEVARQELAQREAYLLEQQQAAEQRLAAANARADAALQEANQVLQQAQATADQDNDNGYNSYGYGYYYPFYGYGTRYLYKGYRRFDGNLYRKKFSNKHPVAHPLHNRFRQKSAVGTKLTIPRGRPLTHSSRAALFRARHGSW